MYYTHVYTKTYAYFHYNKQTHKGPNRLQANDVEAQIPSLNTGLSFLDPDHLLMTAEGTAF